MLLPSMPHDRFVARRSLPHPVHADARIASLFRMKQPVITAETDDIEALVPGVDLAAFTMLSPTNPEHTLFLLNPAQVKSCAK